MIRQNVPLKDYSNYKIGGNASYFLDISTKEELIESLREWSVLSGDFPDNKKEVYILGGGTNILFSDEGFDGLVIKNSIKGIELNGDYLLAGAGELVTDVIDFCTNNALSGFEWAGGLPGTIGGAVRGNAGAFGGETKDNVDIVRSLNFETLQEVERDKQKCGFSYRNSVFKTEEGRKEIILSVVYNLQKRDAENIKTTTNKNIEYRKLKHPLEYPNIGSIFKNIPFDKVPENLKQELSQYLKNDPFPVVPTAKLIFLAGLKGKRVGDVMISEKHTNFIVNLGNGKASEVKELIGIIKQEIKDKFGMSLEEEVMFVGGDLNG